MHTIELNTGAAMPALGFGTWRLNGDECERAVQWALEAGYRHIDTAAMYQNEETVGAAIAASDVRREDLFVTTKLAGRDHGRPAEAAADSARRLGLDYIDCYLIHWPAGSGADVAVWRELESLHRDGVLRAIGVSNYSASQVRQLLDDAEVAPAVNQLELNPFVRQRPTEQVCRAGGVALQAYQPIGRAARFDDPRVQKLADYYDRSPAQIMLRWGLQQGYAVLPKSAHRDRISTNAAVFDFELSADDMHELDALG